MKVLAVCRGAAETLAGLRYKSGINKTSVGGPVMVDAQGIVGDRICNRRHHGGIDQAIYIEGSLTLDWWGEELGRPLPAGTFGENLVIDGLDNRDVAVGDRLYVGDIALEVTAPRIPCATFAAKMGDPKFVRRYAAALRPGIYCRVIAGGMLEAGEPVTYQSYDGPHVLLPALMVAIANRPDDTTRERLLEAPLAHRFRAMLES
ncbi:MOSC domain-containing protein [Rhizobium daejeonense]|uniref:MOSC domain-containing protein n=1 Tax=Rhizobium daejeonense TaxID=240521 RepID=A0A6M1S6X7_9HYPH|nr:MOSC domain-containing protein [Rhizobium daejeonense]NGO65057.1 MOSC domain-containing protein [Rhizobium daejeonense]